MKLTYVQTAWDHFHNIEIVNRKNGCAGKETLGSTEPTTWTIWPLWEALSDLVLGTWLLLTFLLSNTAQVAK